MKNIIIIISVLLLASCRNNKKTEQLAPGEIQTTTSVKLTEVQIKSASLQLSQLEQKKLSSLIKVSGKIDVPPQNLVSVSMPLGGYLKSTSLLPGMHINKGEIIATLEDQQYIQLQQDYLTLKSKVEYTETEFFRQQELNQIKASSDKVYQQAQFEFKNATITMHALAEKLKLININPLTLTESNLSRSVNIYSPIEGFVSKVNVNIGKYVTPADILFELVNPTDIHLQLKVFEKDLMKLSIGQKVLAYTNYNPNLKHQCEIILISRDLSNERTAEVHCHFEDYDKTLLPGMYMNAEIEVKNQTTMAITEDAVVYSEGGNYVFIEMPEMEYQMVMVETGIKEDGFIEIRNPEILFGKRIVTKGTYTLLMALKNKSEE